MKKEAAAQIEVDHWVYERASAEAKLLDAEAQVALAKLNLGYTEVRAPFDGPDGQGPDRSRQCRRIDGPANGSGRNHAARPDLCCRQSKRTGHPENPGKPEIRERLNLAQLRQGAGRGGPAGREQFLPSRHARIRLARDRPRRTGRCWCAACSPTRTATCCRAFSCASACRWSAARAMPCSCRTGLANDQGGRYLLVVNSGNVVEKRYVQLGEIFTGCARSPRA